MTEVEQILRFRASAAKILEYVGEAPRQASQDLMAAADLCVQLLNERDGWKDTAMTVEDVLAKAEAECRQLTARLAKTLDLLREWLEGYDAAGPDDRPSLREHDIAERVRGILAESP